MQCGLCDELKNEKAAYRRVHETKNFSVLISIGPLVQGHVMVVSRQHYLSMGDMPEELYEEFNQAQKSTWEALDATYRKPVISFEHGPAVKGCHAGACVDHAHLHMMPFNKTISWKANEFGERQYHSGYVHQVLRELVNNGKSYLHIHENGESFIFKLTKDLPSQFMRRVISEQTGKENTWDWAVFPRLEDMLETSVKLKAFFDRKNKK